MDRLIIIGLLILVGLVGFIQLRNKRQQIVAKLNFVEDYLQRLDQYMASRGQDTSAYTWLTENSVKMQSQVGILGIVVYRPPYQNIMINNYHVILGTLPELRQSFGMHNPRLSYEYKAQMTECLLRYQGVIKENKQTLSKELKNPLRWFREGISVILGLPLELVASLGLLSVSAAARIHESWLFRTLVGITAMISLFSAIVGIISGWEQFKSFVESFIP